MVALTIITPTYNRAELLKNAYRSLIAQTNHDFQWLVIDDGSVDNTAEVINGFLSEHPEFEIEYHHKENGGKHTALNMSHQYIKGRYCLVLDSDDILVPTAVEQILTAWKQWENNSDVGRVIFLKADIAQPEKVICYAKRENIPIDTIVERRVAKYGIDCCDTFRTDLFTKYKFPVFQGEGFIGEGAGWFPIELESKAVYINRTVYLCEYHEDGLSKSGRKMRIQNPLGGMYNSQIYMHPRLPLKTRIKKGILYGCYSKFAKVRFHAAWEENPYKLLTGLTYIPGSCLYIYWKRKYLH